MKPYRYKDKIIVNPLMRGGIVPAEVTKRLFEEGWAEVGYNVCFDCIEGRSGLITKPNIKSHLAEVARFFGGDVAEHTFGCRGAQFTVMNTIRERVREEKTSEFVIADPNSHYSTNIAAEMVGLKVVEPPHSGYPEYKVSAQSFQEKIDEVRKEHGEPALIAVTHADPYYGNIAPVEEIGRIASENDIPYMVNAAYTGGVLPINMKEMKADFLTLSAHKSMASIGPLGYLVTNFHWAKKAFVTSREKPDWSGRAFGKKIPNIFGCSVGGLPLISSMMTLPMVKERVKHWDEELKKTERFIDGMEEIGDTMLLGERPHRHHLLHFETPDLWEISKTHRRKGFFLAEDLAECGIVGVHKGLSKHIKLSVYGLGDDEIKQVLECFQGIINKYT
ncbi:MAG: aminotransferase class V-fold PLP-dependent enzyme [Methanobacteriota archaeon]|nr:MAG: aminotransferase class V-fold PLP-dependent enzyme [Euryarchaeota archaeon]